VKKHRQRFSSAKAHNVAPADEPPNTALIPFNESHLKMQSDWPERTRHGFRCLVQ
jgi:hypothetical protein